VIISLSFVVVKPLQRNKLSAQFHYQKLLFVFAINYLIANLIIIKIKRITNIANTIKERVENLVKLDLESK